MARTGRFGSLPGSAPDLTNTIVALMEAYENQRDNNILTAWQKGGEFEGEPVTDQRLKKWFLDRKHEYSKGDPEFDYWSQKYEQVDYDIGESKALLRYAQGAMNEMGMSRWYTSNAKRFPKDSEAWREAMRNGAGYKKAAQEKAHTGTVVSDYEKWSKAVGVIQKNKIDPANKAVDIIDHVLKSMGYGGGTNEFMNLDAKQRNAVNTQIQEKLRSGGRYAKYARQWETLTGSQFSYRSFQRVIRTGVEGSRQQANVSRKYGYSPQAYIQQGADFHTRDVALSVFRSNTLETYLDRRAQYEQDMKDAKSPEERIAIRGQYRQDLRGIQKSLDEHGDEQGAGQVTAEMNALDGKAGAQDIGYIGSSLTPGSSAASVVSGGANDELILLPDGSLNTAAYDAGASLDNAMARYDLEGVANIASGKAFYVDSKGDGNRVPVMKDKMKLANGGVPTSDQYAGYMDLDTGQIIYTPKVPLKQSFIGTDGSETTIEVPGVRMANQNGHMVYFVTDQQGNERTTDVAPVTGTLTWSTPDSNGVSTPIFVNDTPNSAVSVQKGETQAERDIRIRRAAGTDAVTTASGRAALGAEVGASPDGTTPATGQPAASGGTTAPTGETLVTPPTPTSRREMQDAVLNRQWGGASGWTRAFERHAGFEDGAAWEADQRLQADNIIMLQQQNGLDPVTGQPVGDVPVEPTSLPDTTPTTAPVITADQRAAASQVESVFSDALVNSDHYGIISQLSANATIRAETRKKVNPADLYAQVLKDNGIDPAKDPEAAYAIGSAIDVMYLIPGSPNAGAVQQERDWMMNHPAGSYREMASRAEMMRTLDASNKDWKSVAEAPAAVIVQMALDAGVSAADFAVSHPGLEDEFQAAMNFKQSQQDMSPVTGPVIPGGTVPPPDTTAQTLIRTGNEGVTGQPELLPPSNDWWTKANVPPPASVIQGMVEGTPMQNTPWAQSLPKNAQTFQQPNLPNPFVQPINATAPPILQANKDPLRYAPERFAPKATTYGGITAPAAFGLPPVYGAPPTLAAPPTFGAPPGSSAPGTYNIHGRPAPSKYPIYQPPVEGNNSVTVGPGYKPPPY